MKLFRSIFALLSTLCLTVTNVGALNANPTTGDESNMVIYIVIAVIAVLLIGGVIVMNQNKK